MASTFLDYEKANNPFISSLMRGDFPSSVSNISSLGGVLLIPQAVAFDDPVKAFKKFTVTKDFIRDHTALFDPKRPLNFVTLSGLLGKCTTDDPNEKIPSGFYIFDRVSPDKMSSFIDEYNYMIISNSASIFFNSILTLFKDAERLDESKRNVNYIMRSGVLVVGTKSVPFFIIPEILPPTCDPSLMSEPSLDTCAVPISSSSFADPEDNSDNKNSSADDADGDNSEPKEDGDCGEETSSDAAKEFEKQNHYISDFFQKLRLSDAVDVRNSLNKFMRTFVVDHPVSMKDQATVMHTYIKEMANFLVSGHSLWKFPRERSSSNNSSTAATNADGAGIDDEKYEMYLGITEGLEVYLTTKLFDIIFPPASPKKKSELIEDSDLKKKISSHWFVSAKHLDIKIESPKDVSYELEKARRELLKVDNYKTPRDKAVVFSNTCKIIFDMCCNVGKRSCSADDFFPYMVLLLLKTNPPNLISNIKYTREFRSPDQMQNEALFFLTNIFSAVSFILSMNAESLSITPGFYEKLVHQSPPKYFSFQDVALDLTINGGVCGPTDSDDIELAVAAGMTGENDDDAATAAAVVSHFAQKKSVFNRSMTFLTTDSEDVLSKFTFYECRYEDLKARDVEELLRQYKELYKIVEGNVKHKKIFDSADNDSSTTTSKSTVDTHFIPTTSPI